MGAVGPLFIDIISMICPSSVTVKGTKASKRRSSSSSSSSLRCRCCRRARLAARDFASCWEPKANSGVKALRDMAGASTSHERGSIAGNGTRAAAGPPDGRGRRTDRNGRGNSRAERTKRRGTPCAPASGHCRCGKRINHVSLAPSVASRVFHPASLITSPFQGAGKHRSRNNCPVFLADHHTECDGYSAEATAISRTMLSPLRQDSRCAGRPDATRPGRCGRNNACPLILTKRDPSGWLPPPTDKR